jgi:rubrerythrin
MEVFCLECNKFQNAKINDDGTFYDSCEHVNGYLLTDIEEYKKCPYCKELIKW